MTPFPSLTTRNRFSRRRILAGTAATSAAALFAAACGGGDSGDSAPSSGGTNSAAGSSGSATPEQPVRGGTINLPMIDVQHFDYQVQFTVFQTLYANRLLRYKTGAGIEPNQYEIINDLAESWQQPAPDQLIVKLHPAKFHNKPPVDGRTVSSEDVKATLELLRTDKPNYIYRYLSDFITDIQTPDPLTVSFKLAYPTPLIFNALAYYNAAIAPKEVIVRDGNLQKLDIGTGPFTLDRYEKGIGASLKRNPEYFITGQPYVDGVELNVIPDANGQLDALRTGKIDAIDEMPLSLLAAAERTLDKSNTAITSQPGVGWSAFWYNTQKPPFNDLRLRQAIHHAIDRTAINNLVSGGKAKLRTGPVSRGWSQWSRSDAEIAAEAKRDVARAKQLLAAAGYSDGLEIEWMYSSYAGATNPRTIQTGKTAEVIQQQLKDAGINMRFNLGESTAFNNNLQTQNFTFSTWTIRAYPDPDDYLYPFFTPDGSKNYGKVNDPALANLILKSRQETDIEKRRAILQEIDRRWTTDFAYATWTIEDPFNHPHRTRLRNYAGRNPLDYAGLAATFIKER